MANTKISDISKGIVYTDREAGIWLLGDDMKKLKKFWKWAKRHRLKPGDIIPKKIFEKYFRRVQ